MRLCLLLAKLSMNFVLISTAEYEAMPLISEAKYELCLLSAQLSMNFALISVAKYNKYIW
jgi:hypothetical protein